MHWSWTGALCRWDAGGLQLNTICPLTSKSPCQIYLQITLFKFTFRFKILPPHNLMSVETSNKRNARELSQGFFFVNITVVGTFGSSEPWITKNTLSPFGGCLCTVQLAGNKQTAAAAAVGNEESACFRRISLLASGHKYMHHNSVHLERDGNRNHKSTKEM